MEITQEIAKNILTKRKVVNAPGVYESKIRVSSTVLLRETADEDGVYQPYRIVNTDLLNGYLAKEANALYKDGKFQEATNKGLTFRANLALAEKLDGAIYANIEVDEVELKDKSRALMIRTMKPMAAEKPQAFNFSFEEETVVVPVVNAELEVA